MDSHHKNTKNTHRQPCFLHLLNLPCALVAKGVVEAFHPQVAKLLWLLKGSSNTYLYTANEGYIIEGSVDLRQTSKQKQVNVRFFHCESAKTKEWSPVSVNQC